MLEVGSRYNSWTVVAFSHVHKCRPQFKCQCDCGTVRVVDAYNLSYGSSTNCGCQQRMAWNRIVTRHGDSKARASEYVSWCQMKSRCLNTKNKKYADYGGRGIQVCERWIGNYADFLADMGRKPSSKHTLDRIDVDGHYSPENCRWATKREQALNQRHHKNAKFVGIWFSGGRWQSQITKDLERKHLGSFKTPEEAAAAYARAAKELYPA